MWLLPLTEKAGEPDDKVRYEAIAAVKAIDSQLALAEKVRRAFSGGTRRIHHAWQRQNHAAGRRTRSAVGMKVAALDA